MLRIPFETKALDDDFQIKKEDYYGENGGVVFPNPNAPTGILMPLSEIEDIIAHNRNVIVVVDEAYIDFGGESALPLIEKYDKSSRGTDLFKIAFPGRYAAWLCDGK